MKYQVEVGDEFESRRGAAYRVVEVDAKGYTVERFETSSRVRIGWRKVEATRARLEAGEVLKYQAHVKDGGVSYTVAEAVSVIYALRDMVVETPDGWAAREVLPGDTPTALAGQGGVPAVRKPEGDRS
jgi:hypothetical protein